MTCIHYNENSKTCVCSINYVCGQNCPFGDLKKKITAEKALGRLAWMSLKPNNSSGDE